MLSLTSGKKITNEKVFKYQSAGDKTIEIVESAKLPQLAHHLRPIFGLFFTVPPKKRLSIKKSKMQRDINRKTRKRVAEGETNIHKDKHKETGK